jgi:hypothetical protein
MTPEQQINAMARRNRLSVIRDWLVGLGVTAFGLALSSLGAGLLTNPEAWAPTGGFRWVGVPLLTGGGLRWLALPLLACGVLLLIVSLVLTIYIKKSALKTKANGAAL